MNLTHFRTYNKQDILSITGIRKFETRLGERLQVLQEGDVTTAIRENPAPFIIIGIPEDIGVQANYGKGGTSTCWMSFLQAFFNIQSNDFLTGENICVAGHFDFTEIQQVIERNAHDPEERVQAYRHALNAIDEEVEDLVKLVVSAGKLPIVIGGGHNNAYPLIKGAAKGLHQREAIPLPQINAINLDAHTDYRPMEGRHSGNGFRYAEEDGYLQKYCIVGVHENYLPQNVWLDIVNNPFIDFITYEDIFIHEKRSFRQAVSHAIEFTGDNYAGIELDLDSIENVLSSAVSPSGLKQLNARQYVNLCAAHVKACYLHICEGATEIHNGKSDELTGKLVSYLVSDFIKMKES